jgi:hypothetical protein
LIADTAGVSYVKRLPPGSAALSESGGRNRRTGHKSATSPLDLGPEYSKEADLHKDARSALTFLGAFFGLLVLIAVVSVGAWWFFTHFAPKPLADRHATGSPVITYATTA